MRQNGQNLGGLYSKKIFTFLFGREKWGGKERDKAKQDKAHNNVDQRGEWRRLWDDG